MPILGIEAVIYGVEDLELNARFWRDFGLSQVSSSPAEQVLETQNGARTVLRRPDDTRLPGAYAHQNSVRETIWGVDTQASLDGLVAGLRTDREVEIDEDGVAHLVAEGGIPIGLKVWAPKPYISAPDTLNAPGRITRLNQHRKWRMKCAPKTINHIVFFVNDYVATYEFFRDRLGFRYTDHSKGIGVFVRADGAFEHHNMFFVSMDTPIAPEKPGFMHLSFGLEDIDELMLGVNIMDKAQWKNHSSNTQGGLSRHRISSAMYYYYDIPSGGEAEYNVDSDYVDDNWIPRAWDFKFGSLLWATRTPAMWQGDVPMDMSFDPEAKSLEPYRRTPSDGA